MIEGVATLDLVIVVVIVMSACIGLVRGFVTEVLSLVAWLAAFIIGLLFAGQLAAILPGSWGGETVRYALAFVLLFFATLILAGLLQWLLAHLIESTGLSGTDRLLGFLFGSARGLVVAIVVLMGVREIASDTPWWQAAKLPPQLLAFEDELRDLLGLAQDVVRESRADTTVL